MRLYRTRQANTPAASAGEVVRVKGNGSYTSASGTDATGCIWAYVYVSKGGTKTAPQTSSEKYMEIER